MIFKECLAELALFSKLLILIKENPRDPTINTKYSGVIELFSVLLGNLLDSVSKAGALGRARTTLRGSLDLVNLKNIRGQAGKADIRNGLI